MTQEDIEQFKDYMHEINDTAMAALELIPKDSMTRARAESYWYPTITGCVGGTATMTTMHETLHELLESMG